MAYEQKAGSGSLFINNKKEKDSHPDRKGDALIHCPHCSANFAVQIGGWLKETPKAGKFLSLSIKPKEDPGAYREPARLAPTHREPEPEPDSEQDIPF